MTDIDILERLREEVEYTPVVGATRYRLVSLLGAVEREIERLRAENDGLRAMLRLTGSLKDEIERAYAEVDEWKDRYEAERADHEATMKHADEKR